MLLLLPLALAGDVKLYERALALIDEHYLYPSRVDRHRMFVDAGQQLEAAVEWLIVEDHGGTLRLRDGQGDWEVDLVWDPEEEFPEMLAKLEDAVRSARRPADPAVDLRVEVLRGVVKSLDRHSVVLHAEGLERFDERLSGTLTDIGVTLARDGGELVVKELAPLGPAERGGVTAGDRLLRIDGVSTVGMTATDAGARIRGPAGTPVAITLRRENDVLEVTLLREEVKIRNVSARVGPNGVGVVSIAHFSEQTHDWLRQSLDELDEQSALRSGLVVDLRGNTGGSLIQSADAADTFLSGGLIATTSGRDGVPIPGLIPRLEAQADARPFAMPLAVLMDHSTASGSEILAGSLEQLDRALLVGTPSFGKGTVQKVYQLAPDVKLKLTVAEYLLADGERVHEVGLAPDVALVPYRFDADGVWYPEAARERARLRPGTPILPAVEELPGWRPGGSTPAERDAGIEITARILAAAEGASRSRLLDTVSLLRPRLEDSEDARVVSTFAARGIDWTLPPASKPPGEPDVRVRLDFHNGAVAGQATEVVASVRNEGADLYRTAVRLRSVDRLWDDRVLPIGRLNHGEARTGTTIVHIPASTPSRADEVEVLIEAHGVDARRVDTRWVTVEGASPPPLRALAHATLDSGRTSVVLDITNEGDRPLNGFQARFDFPDVEGIELLDESSPRVTLLAGETRTLVLQLAVGEAFRETRLPLELTLSADAYGTVARWRAGVPRDGSAIRLDPPEVTIRATPAIQVPGTTTLQIRLADDRGLDHVVVVGGTEAMNRSRYEPWSEFRSDKLAYRALSARRAEQTLTVPVEPGTNRFEVTAEDRSGLRTTRVVYVLGAEVEPTVSEEP